MKLQYFGTSAGGGIPEIFCSCRVCENARRVGGKEIRSRSQAVLDGAICIDYSVDTFAHTAYRGLDLRNISHFLITHGHHDHFLHQDVISRPQGVPRPVRFYGSPKSMGAVKRAVDANEEAYRSGKRIRTCDYRVEIQLIEELYRPFSVLDYEIIPLHARHDEKVESLNYVIRKGDRSILWAHDTGKFHTETVEFLRESGICFDLVSLDCTLKRGNAITQAHMDIEGCAEMAELLRANGNADSHTRFFLSHIGHLVEQTHEELCREAEEFGFEVAYDGLAVEI